MVVQWLRLHPSNAGGAGSIPGQGTKIAHAVWHGQKKFFLIKKEKSSPICNITGHIIFKNHFKS